MDFRDAPLKAIAFMLVVGFSIWMVFVRPAPVATPDPEFGFSQSLIMPAKPLPFAEEIAVLNPGGCEPSEPSLYQVEILGAWWCPDCSDLKERVLGTEKILADYCDRVDFTMVEVDPGDRKNVFEGDSRAFYGVPEGGIPQIDLYFNGAMMFRFTGVPTSEAFRNALEQLLNRTVGP